MRPTKYDRDAFVLAAMDDVPQIDYDEQAKKLGVSGFSGGRIVVQSSK